MSLSYITMRIDGESVLQREVRIDASYNDIELGMIIYGELIDLLSEADLANGKLHIEFLVDNTERTKS